MAAQMTFDEMLQCAKQLRCFSENSLKVLEILDSGSADMQVVARLIGQEPILTGRMLKIANSPFYGLSGQVGSIKEACIVLGLYSIRCMVVVAGASGCYTRLKQRPQGAAQWRHAVMTAAVAQVIAKRCGQDGEAALIAGLLHDIGQVVMSACAPEVVKRIAAHQTEHQCPFVEAENALLNFDHARLSGEIAVQWRLPERIGAAIAFHHSPELAQPAGVADITHVADVIAHAMIRNEQLPKISRTVLQRLSLSDDALPGMLAEIKAHVDEVVGTMGAWG